jgi:hypothetical protein
MAGGSKRCSVLCQRSSTPTMRGKQGTLLAADFAAGTHRDRGRHLHTRGAGAGASARVGKGCFASMQGRLSPRRDCRGAGEQPTQPQHPRTHRGRSRGSSCSRDHGLLHNLWRSRHHWLHDHLRRSSYNRRASCDDGGLGCHKPGLQRHKRVGHEDAAKAAALAGSRLSSACDGRHIHTQAAWRRWSARGCTCMQWRTSSQDRARAGARHTCMGAGVRHAHLLPGGTAAPQLCMCTSFLCLLRTCTPAEQHRARHKRQALTSPPLPLRES